MERFNEKITGKKGITLLMLVVTLAVCAILITTIITQVGNNINNSRIASYISSLETIENSVKEYYYSNNQELPKKSDTEYNKDTLKSNIELYEEIKLNKDDGDNVIFYEIDINKLNVANIDGEDAEDKRFIVAYPSMNVYKLTGYKVGEEYYYSLSSKLKGINSDTADNVQAETDNNTNITTGIENTTSLKITKIDKSGNYTNKINVLIQGQAGADESITINLSGVEAEKHLSLNANSEVELKLVELDDLKDIGFTANEIETFKNVSSKSKYIEVKKIKNGMTIEKQKVALDKCDTLSPQINDASNISIIQTNIGINTENVIYLSGEDVDVSGLKEVRYDYLLKYSEDETTESTTPIYSYPVEGYYENVGINDRFDINYLLEKGKKTVPASNGKFQLHIPENIARLQLVLIDNAGNINVQPYVLNVVKKANGDIKVESNGDKDSSNVVVTPGKPQITSVDTVSGTWQTKEANLRVIDTTEEVGTITLYYQVDGGNWEEISDNGTIKVTKEGETKITVKAVNNQGDEKISDTFTVMIDTKEPEVESITQELTENGVARLQVNNAIDAGSGLADMPYSFDNGNTWQVDNYKEYDTQEKNIIILVKDKIGNIYTSDNITIDVVEKDTTSPTVTLTETSGANAYPSVVTITATDNRGLKSLTMPDGTVLDCGGAKEYTTTYNATKNGPINVTATNISNDNGDNNIEVVNVREFITEWTITEANTEITLPIVTDTPNIYIDWGDGTKENVTTISPTHTYTTAGIYNIEISGYLPYWNFQSKNTSASYVTGLKQWGILNSITMDGAFYNCRQLSGNIPIPSNKSFEDVIGFYNTFYYCKGLTGSIPESLFANCNNVTTFEKTFYYCSSLTGSIPEKLFINNSNITTFNGTFSWCKNLTGSIPENLFEKCSNVTDFSSTFSSCSNLTGSIPETLFSNCPNVLNFGNNDYSGYGTFCYCSGLTGSIPENLFANNPNVTSFGSTFEGCRGITNIPENLFANSSSIKRFNDTFAECSNLTSIPETLFTNCKNVSNIISLDSTFEYCTNLTEIPKKLFINCTEVFSFYRVFAGCSNLTSIPENLFANNPNVTSFGSTFESCRGITNIPENLFYNCTQVGSFEGVFERCENITQIPENLFVNNHNVTTFGSAFSDCENITQIPENLFAEAYDVQIFQNTFASCINIIEIPQNLFANCENVRNFYYTFYNCDSITTIPEKLFVNCENVDTFKGTFSNCNGLIEIPLTLFDNCINVTNFSNTFSESYKLTGNSPELWNTTKWPNVTSYTSCFYECTNLSNYSDIPTDWK